MPKDRPVAGLQRPGPQRLTAELGDLPVRSRMGTRRPRPDHSGSCSAVSTVDSQSNVVLPHQPGRIGQATAVEQSRAVAEVEAAIIVAQRCPRNIDAALQAMEYSC